MKRNLKVDLKNLKSQLVDPFSKQLKDYEKKAMQVVKDLDLRTREARDKSKVRLDEFVDHLNKTRTNVEKQVKKLMDQEHKRLNKRVSQLFDSLKSASKIESKIKKTTASKKRKTSNTKKKKTKKAATTARKRAKSTSKAKLTPKSSAPVSASSETSSDVSNEMTS